MAETPKPAFYAIIPAHVRYHRDLKANEKLLYGEITALCNERGYCWAGNEYFAGLYEVDSATVSRWIGGLTAAGLVLTETVENKRRITIAPEILAPAAEKQDTVDLADPKDVLKRDVRTFLTWWGERYKAHFGDTYLCNFSKDTTVMKKLAAIEGMTWEEIQTRAEAYMNDQDAFVAKNGYSIGLFFTRFNSYGRAIATRKDAPSGTAKTNRSYGGFDSQKYPTLQQQPGRKTEAR
jgi:hypothetical protein